MRIFQQISHWRGAQPNPHHRRQLALPPLRCDFWVVLVLVGMGAVIQPAWATLGGNRASVDADRLALSGQMLPAPLVAVGNYQVVAFVLPTGTQVNEYVSDKGLVFAVSWAGPFKPDVRQLLGPHFDKVLQRQAGQSHAGHPYIHQHEVDLVMESGGHQGNFAGRAYLPADLPAGLSVDQIR